MTKKPMTCQEFVDTQAAYLDDELVSVERLRADEHLAGCGKCAAYLRGYKQAIELAKDTSADDMGQDALPENMVRKIVAARRRS
jgi:predicted anti-sigma-YlaC factor YlaD